MQPDFFSPPRSKGLVVHLALLLVLTAFSLGLAWLSLQARVGPAFIGLLFLMLLALLPVPFLIYRIYALLRSSYTFDRDNLRLQWGLRLEQIPIADVEWVRPLPALTVPPPLPWLRLPGSILGLRRHPEYGPVEFLAAETESLLLVATARRVFAISPADPAAFVQEFQRVVEMGSLTPQPPQSVYPSFVVLHAWESPLTRFLWLSGLFLNLGMLIWVSTLVPSLERVSLGFLPSRAPQQPVPGVQLILLPLLSLAFFAGDWLAGLFVFRREELRTLAFILWIAGALTALLFLAAVVFAISTPLPPPA
jgi:hypothetical protein